MIGRLRTLWPVFGAYFGLAALYAWQASERKTPTIFTDEIEFTQISRSIAETGRAALRGGEPAPDVSLYAYLAAPAWWLDDVGSAYGAIKVLGVLLMTAAIFPAYALARLVVSRPYALVAAIGTAAAPALAYAPFLVDEPLAYPVSTLALLLIARAGIRPSKMSVGLALAVCFVAVFVRTQLAILLPVLGLVLLSRAWRGEQLRRWRATWTGWDWAGAATLLVGVGVVISALLGHRSATWYTATGFFKSRMLEYGIWALGSLAIGVGIIPLIATLTWLVGRRGEQSDEPTATLATLTASAIAAFCLYTAVKAAYLSTRYGIVIAERNLIYLVPLLFIGTALLLERRKPSLLAILASTAFAVYLIKATPHALDRYPNYEAHGLAIAAFANRIPKWPAGTIETALVLVALGSGLALVALRVARSARVGLAVGAVIAAFALTWTLTTEIYAANGERHASDQQYGVLPLPPSWVDNLTGGERTALVGQGISDPNPIWQLEFWNRSIQYFMGIDSSAPGPGQTATPNLDTPNGTLAPHDLGAEYAVAVGGVAIAAPKVTTVGGMELYRLGGKPVRLRETKSGVAADGWMGERASYTQYDVSRLGRGYVKVFLSRQAACFQNVPPANATVRVGPVAIDRFEQPSIGRVTATRRTKVFFCQPNPVVLPVPAVPWRVEVSIDPTFSPAELDPSLGDRRQLGAVVAFEFLPKEG
jgi:hypothetical protein